MKLFKYTCGEDEKIGIAADQQDAYERRGEVHPTFSYLPVTIEEVTLPGYVIEIQPVEIGPTGDATPAAAWHPSDDEIDSWEKPELRAFLDANEIEYTVNWGEKRLRETIKTWIAEKMNKED